MNLKFWKKKKEPFQSKSQTYTGGQTTIPLQDNDFLQFALGHGAGLSGYDNLTNQQAMAFYRKSSSLATAVDMISQEGGRINPVLKNPDGSLDSEAPVLEKLNNPNDWNEDFNFLFSSMLKSYLLTGDNYTYASGIVTQPPLEIYAPKPQNVNVTAGSLDQRPTGFTIYNGDGQGSYSRKREKNGFRFYDGSLKEIWQTSMFSSKSSNISGDSPLMAICVDIDSQLKGKIHNVKLIDNGGRPSLLVAFKDTLTGDQHTERRQLVNEQLAGADNAGKIAVISSTDMELKELGVNNKDMDYANLEKIAAQSIYKRYRIPLPLVFDDAATDNNMEHAVYQLYDFAVLPRVDELLASLSMFLLPRYGLDPSQYSITYNPEEIEALKKRRVEILKMRKELGIETVNELRKELPGLEDVDGGEFIYQGANLIKLGEDMTSGDLL